MYWWWKQDNIDQHLTTRSAEGDEAPRDFIDVYLDEMKEHSKKYKTTTFKRKYNDKVEHLLDIIVRFLYNLYI